MAEAPRNGETPADGSISSKASGRLRIVRLSADLQDHKTRSKSVTASAGSRRLVHTRTNSTHTSGYGLGDVSMGSVGLEGNRGSKSLPQGAKLTRRQAQQAAVSRVMEQTSKLNAKFSQKMDFIETQRLQCVSMAIELMQKTEELNQKVVVPPQERLAGPDDEVIPGTKIPKNFYVEAMLNILAEKWKNRKFSLVHSEKMAALRTKYEAVQKIINNVIMANMKEKEESERLRRKELKKDLLKKMVTQYDSSINRASTYQSTVGRKKEPLVKLVEVEKNELTDSILHESRLNLSLDQRSNTGSKPSRHKVEVPSLDEGLIRNDTFGERSSASPTARNDRNDSFVHLKVYGIGANDFKNSFGFEVEKRRKDIKSTDKVLKDLRLKIDNTYMKFAKRTAYTTLYNREKVELAEENQAFRANLRNFRRKKEIADNFLGGGSIEHLRPGILTNPLKNIYLETHKNKFDNPDARFFDKEDKEIFQEETKKLLETHLPEEYAHLQPKLLKILRETKHLDLSKQSIKAVRDINTQPTNPLADKWKLNLFCKYKADKYYKNMDFPKKARHRHQREEGEFESDSSDHEEPGGQRRLFIKEENEIDKYNSVNYMYAKSRSRRDQQKADLLQKQRDFSLNLAREDAHSDTGSKAKVDTTGSDVQEKKLFKRKIAGFYDMLNKFQGRLRRDNQKIDNDLVAKQNFLKQLSTAHDKSYALHKLVKDSIAETYDEVKNNPRASTIKRYVCSAKSYFKNANKV